MNDYQRLEAIFNRFAANPKTQVSMPLGKQFWGAIFGSLVDPFGVNWMFSSDAQDKKN
jgi:PhnB protein